MGRDGAASITSLYNIGDEDTTPKGDTRLESTGIPSFSMRETAIPPSSKDSGFLANLFMKGGNL